MDMGPPEWTQVAGMDMTSSHDKQQVQPSPRQGEGEAGRETSAATAITCRFAACSFRTL